MEEFQTIADLGYALDQDGFDDHLVLGRFSQSCISEKADHRGFFRELRLRHGDAITSIHAGNGNMLVLASPDEPKACETAEELHAIIESEGFLDEGDYYEVVDEEAQGYWCSIEIDERVNICRVYDIPIANSLKSQAPPEMSEYIMENYN